MSVELSLAGFPQLPAVLSFIESTRISHVEWHVAPFAPPKSSWQGASERPHLLFENGNTGLVFDATSCWSPAGDPTCAMVDVLLSIMRASTCLLLCWAV